MQEWVFGEKWELGLGQVKFKIPINLLSEDFESAVGYMRPETTEEVWRQIYIWELLAHKELTGYKAMRTKDIKKGFIVKWNHRDALARHWGDIKLTGLGFEDETEQQTERKLPEKLWHPRSGESISRKRRIINCLARLLGQAKWTGRNNHWWPWQK